MNVTTTNDTGVALPKNSYLTNCGENALLNEVTEKEQALESFLPQFIKRSKALTLFLSMFVFMLLFSNSANAQSSMTAYNNSSTCSVQVWCIEYCNGIGFYINDIGLLPPGGQVSWVTPYCTSIIRLVPEGHSYTSGTVYDEVSCNGSWNESSSGTCNGYTLSANPYCGPACSVGIANQPQDQSFCNGSSPTMCVTATGTDISYQWEFSWDGVNAEGNAGETGNTTSCLSNFPENAIGAYFRARVTSASGCEEYSDWARITGNTTSNVSAGSDQAVCPDNTATLNASGANYYYWSTGATTASINVSPTVNTTYTVTGYSPSGGNGNIVSFNPYNFSLINATNAHGNSASLFDGIDNTAEHSFHANRTISGQTWGIRYDLGSSFLISTVGLNQRDDCCHARARGGIVQVYNNGALVYASNTVGGSGDGILSVSPSVIGDRVEYVFPNGINTQYNSGTLNFSEWIITGQTLCSSTDDVNVTIEEAQVCLCENAGGDSDNDGICDNEDCQPNNPNLPTTPGSACNDGNANTINDVIQANGCDCAGTFDACALNGGDSDNDGICNNQDCAPYNPNLPAIPGSTCNDGNANTINDVIQGDGCTCVGVIDDCFRLGGDSDNDGVCDSQDCAPNNPFLPAAVGSSCNDGNANTSNDVIQADGCTCAGTPDVTTPDCANIGINSANGNIVITGLDGAPITSVQVFNAAWAGVYSCFANCNTPTENISVPAGNYIVYVKYYNADYSFVCQESTTITVVGGGGGCTDWDNDGVCANEDCDDDNPNIPTTPGTACNDGDANTNNDVIQADGCTCAGTPNGGGGTPDCANIGVSSSNGNLIITGLDGAPITSVQVFTSAWAGVYNCFANCNTPTETIPLTPGDYLVYVKYYNADYSLVCQEETTISVIGGGGGCTDWDNDGICANVDCDDENPNVPATVGSACNDGNGNTINDVIQADGCTCAGTPNGGGDELDIALEVTGNGDNVGIYQIFSVTFTVSNPSDVTSNNVIVNIPQPNGVVFQGGNPFTASTGDYNYYSTFNWAVGSLTPWAVETITLNYYTIADGPYTVYGQVTNASGNDIDSTPNNGTPPNPNEDDEAAYNTGNGGGGGCTDWDNDGVCAADDCDDDDASVPAAAGTACNDGNANTNNDVIQADGCTCAGTLTGGGGGTNCDDVMVSVANGSVTLSGLDNAPLTAAWVFDSNWTTVFNCSYGCSATEIVDLGEGTYYVIVKKLNLDWSEICVVEETVVIENGTTTNPCDNLNYTGLNYLGTLNDKDYYIKLDGDVNYETALSIANGAGGTLLTINSAEENNYIAGLLNGDAWLGLTDVVSEGNFVWNTGEAVTYVNWTPNEPNNAGNEDYAKMYSNGSWNDVSAGALNWAVVELPACNSGFNNDGVVNYSQNNDNEAEIAELRNESVQENFEDISFKVYPNPASDYANIAIQNTKDVSLTIVVIDQFGRAIDQVNLQSFENESYRLNTSNYSSGLYFVQIRNSEAILNTKQLVIVKQ